MKASLAGSNPSPLELLLVERIVACWLQTCHADAAAAQTEGLSKRQAEFTVKRQDSAHRRYLMAIATLPMTRRLLAAAQPKSGQSARPVKASSRSGAIAVEGGADKNEVVLGCVPAHTDQVDRDARRPRRAGGPAER